MNFDVALAGLAEVMDMLAPWQRVLRNGIFPQISTRGLEALRDGLEKDDPALLQGSICTPPPLCVTQDFPVESADAVVYPMWKGDFKGDMTVANAEEVFATVCYECDKAMGDPASVRFWLNRWDDEPRNRVFHELLIEVGLELAKRER